jgi:hypothetical protein
VDELDVSARLGAQITIFRLGSDPGLARFVDSLAARVDGRVVAPELDDLGVAVVDSYLGSRWTGGAGSGHGGSGYGGWFDRGGWVDDGLFG